MGSSKSLCYAVPPASINVKSPLCTTLWQVFEADGTALLLAHSVACQLSASTSYRPGVYGQLSGIKTGVIRVALFFTLCKFCCVSCLLVYPV